MKINRGNERIEEHRSNVVHEINEVHRSNEVHGRVVNHGSSKISGRLRSIFAAIIIGVLVFLAGLAVYSYKSNQDYPDYTSYNVGAKGYKALYLLTERMGYSVRRFEAPSRLLPGKAVLVAAAPDSEIFGGKLEKKYLLQWLTRGNILILIDTSGSLEAYDLGFITQDPSASDIDKGKQVYICGKGKIVFLSRVDDFNNNGLKNYRNGVEFIELLQQSGQETVLFNEFYHGIISRKLSFLDLLGPAGLAFAIQLGLAFAVFLYLKSRRLGKPVTIHEIYKRPENENLFAMANIYVKAGANTIVLQNYLTGFKKELAKYLGFQEFPDITALEGAVSKNQILRDNKLIEVLKASDKYIEGQRAGTSKLVRLIQRIEKIRREISR